ncbi:unnamed protein product [Oikopleura dioica]|uniref:Uncharacterized protein n=1 Tax=Oikopleura dioica TaxID=34765 RepID=E4XKC4_OIKDI|nr:unnamed protein product [Oikopleura dioica]
MAKNISISANFLPQVLRTAIFMITLGLVVLALPANRPEWSCSLLKQIAANLKSCVDAFFSTGIHTFIYNWLLDIYPRSFTLLKFIRLLTDAWENVRFFCCCSLGHKIHQSKKCR